MNMGWHANFLGVHINGRNCCVTVGVMLRFTYFFWWCFSKTRFK